MSTIDPRSIRIVLRHEGGNTLAGELGQVLETHLASGWHLEDVEDQPTWEARHRGESSAS